MKKTELYATHRKCLTCGCTSTDLDRTKCQCGHHMYLLSQVYEPKVQKAGMKK